MKNLTLIIPVKNEKEALPILLEEIKNYTCNILIIIDSSDKETFDSIKHFKNLEIIHQKGKGFGGAIVEGINICKSEFCCIMCADSSMDPKYLKDMLKLCKNKEVVFGSRYAKGGGSDDDDIITFIGNKIFTFIGNIFFNLKISDILFTYILGKTKSLQMLNLKYTDFRVCVEIPIKVHRQGLTYETISCFERSRVGGKKKVNVVKDGFLILIALIMLFFV